MKDPIMAELRRIRNGLNKMIRENPAQFEAEIQAIREQCKDRLYAYKNGKLRKVALKT
jgi:hypothetical protein